LGCTLTQKDNPISIIAHGLSVENGSGVGITGFVDFVDHLIFWENTAVRRLDLFPLSGEKIITSSD
jgi:hypothetical protein